MLLIYIIKLDVYGISIAISLKFLRLRSCSNLVLDWLSFFTYIKCGKTMRSLWRYFFNDVFDYWRIFIFGAVLSRPSKLREGLGMPSSDFANRWEVITEDLNIYIFFTDKYLISSIWMVKYKTYPQIGI